MSIDWGFNFRSTLGYATDGTNEVLGIDRYPHTYSGLTGSPVAGWSGEVGLDFRDRNSGLDRRLAGIAFSPVLGQYFEIDLPATGDYDIHLAAGDAGGSNPCSWDLIDGSTVFATLSGTPASAHFHDATDTDYSAAAWPGSETKVTRTFASTTFKLQVHTGGQNNVIAHLRIVTASGGGGVTVGADALHYYREHIMRGAV